MFAVVVEFRIKSEHLAAFLPLMKDNAAASKRDEPGCLQFDVVQVADDPNLVLLYETYENAQAFSAHRKTPHFLSFDKAVAHMIADKVLRTGAVI